jgi:phosphohistidine phosphatase
MKQLILMRHAKSSWADAGLPDHARVLNARGRRSADAMGDWLRAHKIEPELILCSDAARTRETLARLNLGDIPTTFTRDLYLAEPEVMQKALGNRTEGCILMVAHNPGSATLADTLLQSAPSHPDFYAYPSCATLVADFDIANWRDLQMGTGQATEFVVPRDLIK